MTGLFITFEGTEGGGKSTQIARLSERLMALNLPVCKLREPGSTPIGEEIRHTLKHSAANGAMTPETELLLVNASRAQLVREIIRPALADGKVVLCDRYFDSTIAYQAFGRELDLNVVQSIIDFAVGDTRPDLTFLLRVPIEVSEKRRLARGSVARDRFEEADRAFFERVEQGYDSLARQKPDRVRVIDAVQDIDSVGEKIWRELEPLLHKRFPACR